MRFNFFIIITLLFALTACKVPPVQMTSGSNDQAPPDQSSATQTLKSIVSTTQAPTPPTDSQYYMSVAVATNDNIPVPSDRCASQSFWAFIRKLVGEKTSAAVIVTADIIPKGGDKITVPIYSASASEINSSGVGSTCQTNISNSDVTFLYPSTQNPNFNINISFHVSSTLNSTAVQNTVQAAKDLLTIVGAAAGSPAIIVAKLNDPQIQNASIALDSAIQNNFSSNDTFVYSGELNPGTDGSTRADEIDIKVPHIESQDGGVEASETWDGSIRIFLHYKTEEFKTGNNWLTRPDIMSEHIVTGLPSGDDSLRDLVNAGQVTDGFDWRTLSAANSADSLRQACYHLDDFLSSFLIDDDQRAAKYAILVESPYDTQPSLRTGSDCFNSDDLSKLSLMRADYVFDNPSVVQMEPLALAMASGNSEKIKPLLATNFSLTTGPGSSDYYTGDGAVAKMASFTLSCFQAGNRNPSIIGGILNDGHTNKTALFEFGQSQLNDVEIVSSSAAANALGISLASWLNPTTMACNLAAQ